MNKLTETTVALGSLRRRRGQSLAMILGASLAIFFVSSLFLAVQSILETYRLAHVARVGSQDAILRDAERIPPEALIESGLVTEVGNVYVLGETEGGKCAIGYYDEAGACMAGRQLAEGRMPERPGELAVEPNFLQKLRSDAQVGDRIELSLRIPRGVRAEFLPEPVKKTYRITGILKPQSIYLVGNLYSDFEYLHYPSAVASAAELVEPGGRAVVHRMVMLARGVGRGRLNGYTDENYRMSNALPTRFGLFSPDALNGEHNGTGQIMVAIAGILGAVLILSACMGIINAFSGSLMNRRAQIGMMRAVGATSRQIRRIFGREALLLAVCIAPVAIALSYLFVWGLTRLLGSVSFYANPWFLPIDFLASMLCVALAAWIPLMGASKLPPMQAIRDVSLLRARRRVRVKPKDQYDAPRLIAARHLHLYRTRQSGIAIMAALSMLLISVSLPFVMSLVDRPNPYAYQIGGFRWSTDSFVEVNMTPHAGLTDADIAEVLLLPLVSDVDAIAEVQLNLLVDRVTPYATAMEEFDYWTQGHPAHEAYQRLRSAQQLTREVLPGNLMVLDGDSMALLRPHVLEGRIDLDAINAGREVLVIAPTYYIRTTRDADGMTRETSFTPYRNMANVTTYENDMYRVGDALDILRLSTPESGLRFDGEDRVDYFTGIRREEAQTSIGAILSDTAIEALIDIAGYAASGKGTLLTTHEGLSRLGIEAAGYPNMGIRLSGTPDDATHAYLTDALKGVAARGDEMELQDNLQTAQDNAFWRGVLKACLLAVLLLLLSMCVSLVNNAIANRVRSDKQSIGTLRAVGAPLRDIVSSYRLQAVTMIAWGMLLGMLLSGGYYTWHYLYIYYPHDRPFALPVGFVALAQAAFIGAVMLLCEMNLRARVREITRNSIVSNIREL